MAFWLFAMKGVNLREGWARGMFMAAEFHLKNMFMIFYKLSHIDRLHM